MLLRTLQLRYKPELGIHRFVVVVAQLVEHGIVIPRVAGSSPVDHPSFYFVVSKFGDFMAVSKAEYEKALVSLEESLEFAKKQLTDSAVFKIARDACIQRFEFSVELAWKTSAKQMGSSSTTAKPVVREMAQNKLIDNPELWFDFIEARNRSSHTYDEVQAVQVYIIIQKFIVEGRSLLEKLK